LETLHEVASRRLEELKQAKESRVLLRRAKEKKERRERVEVTMEEDAEETTVRTTEQLVAVEN
jgi:hypothetical protein